MIFVSEKVLGWVAHSVVPVEVVESVELVGQPSMPHNPPKPVPSHSQMNAGGPVFINRRSPYVLFITTARAPLWMARYPAYTRLT